MKVVVYENYGGPNELKIIESEIPKIGIKDVLIKTVASSATTADMRLRSLNMPFGFKFIGRLLLGWNRPKKQILGTEVAGVIVEVGSEVKEFKPNDEVLAHLGSLQGGYAEYVKVAESGAVVKKPKSMSFESAATLSFGFTTAWDYLVKKAKIESGQRVLIVGASGSVGSAAVQIAKAKGASITAICSQRNFQFVRSLGADAVVDYSNSEAMNELKNFDCVFDVVGKMSIKWHFKVTREQASILLVSSDLIQMLWIPWSRLIQKPIYAGPVFENKKTLKEVVQFVEENSITSHIERSYRLDDIVEAHEHIENRHRSGNIAIVF